MSEIEALNEPMGPEMERLCKAWVDATHGISGYHITHLNLARPVVRAILQAMREPSEGMLHAAFVEMNATPSGTWKALKAANVSPERLFVAKMRPRWQAMIDRLLAEPDDTDARAGALDQTGFA